MIAALINPHQAVQCERQFGRGRDIGGLAVSTVTPRGDAPISKACRLWPRLSAFVRPAHQLEGRFDVPPTFGVFAFALLFQGTSLLSGLGNGLVAVCFQQLPSVVVDFAFLHFHGVMLLFFSAPAHTQRAQERWTLTPTKTCTCILACRGGKSPLMGWSSPCSRMSR